MTLAETRATPPSPRAAKLLSVGLLFLATGLTAAAWLYHTLPGQFVLLGRDTFIFLEGTLRTMNGDLPNYDFRSQLGPAMWAIPSLFLRPETLWLTVPVLLVVATALTVLLSTQLLRPESVLNGIALLVILIFCTLAINAPSRFGDTSGTLLWHRIYSNISNTLLIPLTAWLTLAIMGQGRTLSWFAAVLLGVALFLMFTLKVTYFIAAALLLIVAVLLVRELRRDTLRAFVAFATMLLVTTLLFPAVILGYASDILLSARISSAGSSQILVDVVVLIRQYAIQLGILFVLLWFAPRSRAMAVFLMACALITLFIDRFDAGPTKFALLLGVVIGLAFGLSERLPVARGLLCVALLVAALAPSAYIKLKALIQNYDLATDRSGVALNSMRIDAVQSGAIDYVATAQAAFANLDASIPETCLDRGYMVADLVNPFGALLARNGAPTEVLWVHDGLTVSRADPSPFESFLGDASFIMVPKAPLWPSATAFVTETYADDLSALPVAFENEGWTVYGACRDG